MHITIPISIGAILGALSRHYLSTFIMKLASNFSNFPWGIMIVNILGCFMMGILIELMSLKFAVSQEIRAFLTVGFLGSFTTFSTFALDFALLTERGEFMQAIGYFLGSTILCIGALFLGLFIIRN